MLEVFRREGSIFCRGGGDNWEPGFPANLKQWFPVAEFLRSGQKKTSWESRSEGGMLGRG